MPGPKKTKNTKQVVAEAKTQVAAKAAKAQLEWDEMEQRHVQQLKDLGDAFAAIARLATAELKRRGIEIDNV